MSFRLRRFVACADIKQAFLQIRIQESDRDALRFLWVKDLQESTTDDNIVTFRMTRVPFGSTCSPYLLAATVRKHIESNFDPEEAEEFKSSFYVDDFITGDDDATQCLYKCQNIKRIMDDGGFNLVKWKSNSSDLCDEFKRNCFETMAKDEEKTKLLGLVWFTNADHLGLSWESGECKSITKRSILARSSQIFDPLGLISPFVIRAKMIFQKLWEANLGWDDEVSSLVRQEWSQWLSECSGIESIKVPRYIYSSPSSTEKLVYCFCDASPRAYGAVVYIREFCDGQLLSSNLLVSKSRLAPVKQLTLPRLELMAALLGSRLSHRVKTVTRLSNARLFSDSKIVLHWINGDIRRWKLFVSNRIVEISKLSKKTEWNYVRTHLNPADLLTRGVPLANLHSADIWWKGPNETDLNENDTFGDTMCEDELVTTSVLQVSASPMPSPFLLEGYNGFKKSVRVLAYVSRFIFNCKNQNRRTGPLSKEEIDKSEELIIKCHQNEYFHDEIVQLMQKKEIGKSSRVSKLVPWIDERGIMRLGGRIQYSSLDEYTKQPIILDGHSKLADLIVSDTHESIFHGGLAETLFEIRTRYWLIKGRQVVKRIIGKCLTCRRYTYKPLVSQQPALPRERLVDTVPFDTTGIDFAGPLFVKEADGKRKVYIVLFTCATMRAVNLELAGSMDVEAFVLALKRFVTRRGVPSIIMTDNARTFKRTCHELQTAWNMDDEAINNFSTNLRITWKYIVERAPWWGGWWERLVGLTKRLLKRSLGRSLLSFEELATTITCIEGALNSRPISTIRDGPENELAISPSDILVGKRLTLLPLAVRRSADQLSEDSNQKTIFKAWSRRERLTTNFWRIWKRDYLMELRLHCQDHDTREVSVGEVVLLVDDHAPRQCWKLGIIRQVFPGRDGKVRACLVRVASGQEFRRPIQLLVPLEVRR